MRLVKRENFDVPKKASSLQAILKYRPEFAIKSLSDPELEKILSEKLRKASLSARSEQIVKLSDSNFEQLASSEKPLFVDFWAEWCGPCRVMEPVVEKLAGKYSGKIAIGKLNVDEQPSLATKYDVFSIPTFMIFKHGKPVDALIGAVGESMLDKFIQKAVSGQAVYT